VRRSLAALICLFTCAAHAQEWPIERNAQLLAGGELKLGLFGIDVGLHHRVQLGTEWATWVLGGPNIHLKLLLVDHHDWKLAVDTSFFYVNLDHLKWFGVDDVRGHLMVLPVELFLDKQLHPRWLLGLGSGYAATHTSPKYDPNSIRGAGAYDTWFAHGSAHFRAHPRLWLLLEVDWILHQRAAASASFERELDDYTTVNGRAHVKASTIEAGRGGAITLSLVVHVHRFGLRFGVGYGNFVLPRTRLVVPDAIPYLVFDLFGRFKTKS
jgi:hypothetical protein